MKKRIALLLIVSLLFSLLSGCGGDEKAYIPTGDALVMEGEDPTEAAPIFLFGLCLLLFPNSCRCIH